MNVTLVVGGSGMLSELTKKLSKDFDIVGVIGRNSQRLSRLAEHASNIVPISVDYTINKAFESELSKFVEQYGKPHLIISWIHSTAPMATLTLAKFGKKDFYEITGEGGRAENHISRSHERAIINEGLNYHRIILGHVGNRWLYNSEICDGTYAAVQNRLAEFIVGE